MKACSLLVALLLGSTVLIAQRDHHPAAKSPQVLFSGPPPASAEQSSAAPPSHITDADRRSVAITAWDLEVHLVPRDASLEAHARLTLRNNGQSPLTRLPLQLSSTLRFEDIGLGGRRLVFVSTTVASDADHTGQLHEAVVTLPEALAPGATLTLEVDYGGTIPLSAARLTAIGAPPSTAASSDWDRISADFTGLRGFGNVVWYPVSSVPASMGSGDSLFTEIGRQKLLDQDATMSLRVSDEFFSQPPNAVILNGHFVTCGKPLAMPTASFPGVLNCSLPATRLGFQAPSLFLARRTETDGNGLRILSLPGSSSTAQDYIAAAAAAQPLLRTWFGPQPHSPFTLLELPDPGDAPAETGDLIAAPLVGGDIAQLAPTVVDALAHAAFSSPRGWLNEGVPGFLRTLWIDSTNGHTAAMENLNADRLALALAEPASPGPGAGEDLPHAVSAVYYRTKATYVFWMLRNILGDKPLARVLQTYDPAEDTSPDYIEHLLEQAGRTDLHWFFENWVNQDRGLPDLSIGTVFFSPEIHQQMLVAVEIANDGAAEAEVPLTIKGLDTSLTQQVRVPAHGRITHRLTFQEAPTEVEVNDGSVPEVQDSIHRKLVQSTPALR